MLSQRWFVTLTTLFLFASIGLTLGSCSEDDGGGGECEEDSDCSVQSFGEVWKCEEGVCVDHSNDSGLTDGDSSITDDDDDDDNTGDDDDDDDDDNDDDDLQPVDCDTHGEQWCDGNVLYTCLNGEAAPQRCGDRCIETGYQTAECVGGSSDDDDDVTDDDDDNTGACDNNPCVEPHKTVCTEVNGQPMCSCDEGYVMDGNTCVLQGTATGDCNGQEWPIADGGIEVEVPITATTEGSFLFVDVSFNLAGSNQDNYEDKQISVKPPFGEKTIIWETGDSARVPNLFRLSRWAGNTAAGAWKVYFKDVERNLGSSTASQVCLTFHASDDFDSADFDNGETINANLTTAARGTSKVFFYLSYPRKFETHGWFKSGYPVATADRNLFSFSLRSPKGVTISIPNDGANLNTDMFNQVENDWATGIWVLTVTNNSSQDLILENARILVNQEY